MGRERFAIALLAACGGAQPPPSTAVTTPPAATQDANIAPPVFLVEVAPPAPCARATTCEAKLQLTALGDYKVNAEYPFKFVGDTGPAISFEGTGTFAPIDTKTGTMTIRFKSEAAGTIEVSGTFKLSVCTEEVCKIEQPKITFAVPVT